MNKYINVILALTTAALLSACGTQTISTAPSTIPGVAGSLLPAIEKPDLLQAPVNFDNAVAANFDVAQNQLFATCGHELNQELGIEQVPGPAPTTPTTFQVQGIGPVSAFTVIVIDAEKLQQAVVSGINLPQSCAEVQGLINTTGIASILNAGPIKVTIVPDTPQIAALKANALKAKGGKLTLTTKGK